MERFGRILAERFLARAEDRARLTGAFSRRRPLGELRLLASFSGLNTFR